MLSICDPRPGHTCQGLHRREFLRVGALLGSLAPAAAGLSLDQLLRTAQAGSSAGQRSGKPALRDRAVVLLFLQGGPSHIETFDPNLDGPVEFRSLFGGIPTSLPGVRFSSHFPKLAAQAEQFSIVRSYGSANSGHSYDGVTTAGNALKAAASALYARVAGTNNSASGMPNNTLVLPEAVSPGLELGKNFETSALPSLTTPGQLGAAYSAFNPAGGGQLHQDMQLQLPLERFGDRRQLLGQLDRLRRRTEGSRLLDGFDHYRQQAFDVITRGVAEAFDLKREDRRTLEAYDTSGLFSLKEVTRWGDMRRSSNLLGRQMLLARRLVEAGCGFVTVSDCGWDMHSNSNSPKNLGGMKWLGPQVDHAVAAFLQDIHDRGLSDKILLVVTGEMGRTPKINNGGGRDHYGELTPLLLAGGGLQPGQVVGASDRQAARPTTHPYRPSHLLATMMHTLFDLAELRLQTHLPREIIQVAESGQPIQEVL